MVKITNKREPRLSCSESFAQSWWNMPVDCDRMASLETTFVDKNDDSTYFWSKLVLSMQTDCPCLRVFIVSASTLRRFPKSSWLHRRNCGKNVSKATANVDCDVLLQNATKTLWMTKPLTLPDPTKPTRISIICLLALSWGWLGDANMWWAAFGLAWLTWSGLKQLKYLEFLYKVSYTGWILMPHIKPPWWGWVWQNAWRQESQLISFHANKTN